MREPEEGITVRRHPSRNLFVVVVFAALVLAGGTAQRSGAAHGAPPPKLFDTSLSPVSAVRGTTGIEFFSLTNTSSHPSGYRLGSADVSIPSGYQVLSARVLGTPVRDRDDDNSDSDYDHQGGHGPKAWTASVGGGVIHLRAASVGNGHNPRLDTLKPGQSVTVALLVVNPCGGPNTSSWSTVAGSSNTSPAGDFTSASNPTLGATGSCSLSLSVSSPQTAGVPITGTAHVLDGNGHPMGALDGNAVIGGNLDNSPNGTSPVYNTVAFHNGVASGLLATAFDAEGGRTLTANLGAMTISSNSFDVQPNVAFSLAFDQQPSDVNVNDAISPAMTVDVTDQWGNSPSNQVPVTLAIAHDPPVGTTLGGTATQTSAAGVATFSGISLDQAGNGFKLSASSGSLASATSNTFNVNGGTTFCDGTGDCTATNSDGSTTVDTTGSATISFGPPGELFSGCLGQEVPVPARGSIVDIVPGEGYTAANPLGLTFTYSASAVANLDGFAFCISKDSGETYQRVPDCPTVILNTDNANFLPAFTEQDLPCVGPRTNNTDNGSLSFTLLLTSTDPQAGLD